MYIYRYFARRREKGCKFIGTLQDVEKGYIFLGILQEEEKKGVNI